MIIKNACETCGSSHIVKNGKSTKYKQKYHLQTCRCYRTLGTTQCYNKERKEEILRSYHERSSLRGTHRIYGVAVTTVLRWLKKKQRA